MRLSELGFFLCPLRKCTTPAFIRSFLRKGYLLSAKYAIVLLLLALTNHPGIAISQKPQSKFQGYLEQFSQYANVISAASLLGLLLLLGFNTLAGQKTQAVFYEYKIHSVPDLTFAETMNVQGSEGWELVFARRARESSSDDFTYECIFKRVKK